MRVIMLGEMHNQEDQGVIGQELILSRLQIFPVRQEGTSLSLISSFSVHAYAYAYADDWPATCEAPFLLKCWKKLSSRRIYASTSPQCVAEMICVHPCGRWCDYPEIFRKSFKKTRIFKVNLNTLVSVQNYVENPKPSYRPVVG